MPRFSFSPYHFYILSSSSSIHILFLLSSRVFFHFTFSFFSILLSSCYPVPLQGHFQMDKVKFFFLDNQVFYWSALYKSVSARNKHADRQVLTQNPSKRGNMWYGCKTHRGRALHSSSQKLPHWNYWILCWTGLSPSDEKSIGTKRIGVHIPIHTPHRTLPQILICFYTGRIKKIKKKNARIIQWVASISYSFHMLNGNSFSFVAMDTYLYT
jgi:hypothetical protein